MLKSITMSDQQKTNEAYEARVRAIAEEMRSKVTPEERLSAGDLMRACIAVKHTEDAIREAFGRHQLQSFITEYLISEGLMPDQEAAGDGR